MSYLLGSGWWMLWHALLWLAVAPFVWMTVALTRALPNDPTPSLETAFAVSTTGLILLMGATVVSAFLWTAGGSAGGIWPYVRNVGAIAAGALVLGLALVFAPGYYAVTPKSPIANRWAAQLLCLSTVAVMLAFCLHATWRFRHR